MRPVNNQILIDPDEDYDKILKGDNPRTVSVTGTIVGLPAYLTNYVDTISKAKARGIRPSELQSIRRMSARSLDSTSPLEAEIGDRVYFSYLSQNTPKVNGLIVAPYETLICREDLYPFNGYYIIEMYEKSLPLYVSDVNDYGCAKVVRVGARMRFLGGGEGGDVKEGDTIFFDKRQAVRIEVDEFNTLTENQSSLFRIRQDKVHVRIRI